MKLKPAQRDKLSDFSNMLAAAWFTAGVISPLVLQTEDIRRTIVMGFVAIASTLIFVYWSLSLVRKVRL